MRILHAASELFPVIRTGGLGDVVAALPPAQRAQGDDVRLILPGYPLVLAALSGARHIADLGSLLGVEPVNLLLGDIGSGQNALPVYAIAAPSIYDRPGNNPYASPQGYDWWDNPTRFGMLSLVAARLAAGRADPDWRAEILHAHDWHAGLAPGYLRFDPPSVPVGSVFTVHNIAYQGEFGLWVAGSLGVPDWALTMAGAEFWGNFNFMKAGLVYADRVTTVSPGYAREMATPEYGYRLEGVVASRGAAVSGILNGVDEVLWDPAHDPALVSPFDVTTAATARAPNRTALAARYGIAEPEGPLFAVVSRLTPQKGLDLLLGAIPTLLATGGALVLLGTGDPDLEWLFREAESRAPGRIATWLGYDDTLAHQVMAGADVVLVPSRFEPCGLTQLYAMRYGAVPLVRWTGGLGDTVVDVSAPDGTGFIFGAADTGYLANAIWRAAEYFRDRGRLAGVTRARHAATVSLVRCRPRL